MQEEIAIGDIIKGKVINIKPYGAFVSFDGNKKGLIHISQISDSFVRDINEFLMQGDIVNVKVLSIDKDGKVALSLKDAPQDDIVETDNNESEDIIPDFGKKNTKDIEKKTKTLDELIKDFNRQSNDRQVDINKRLKNW